MKRIDLMKNRLVKTAVLAVAVVLCMLSVSAAYAEEQYLGGGTTTIGNQIKYSVYSTNGDTAVKTTVIEGTGAIPDFNAVGVSWNYGREYSPWSQDYTAKQSEYIEVKEGITALGAYCFDSVRCTQMILPESLSLIPENALWGCTSLKKLEIRSRNVVFRENAVIGSPDMTIYGYLNSSAQQYAKDHNIPFVAMDCTHSDTRWDVTIVPTCSSTGYREQICNICGQKLKSETMPEAHVWGSWITLKKATVFEAKLRKHTCTLCGKTVRERQGNPLTPVLKLKDTSYSLLPGSTAKLVVKKMARGDYIRSITSSNSRVAYCAYYTKIIYAGPKEGKAVITVKLASGKTAKVKVEVSKTIKTTKISGVPKILEMDQGGSIKLSPKLTPSNSEQKIKYTSSKPKVASVSKKGVVEALSEGETVITVKSGKISVTCTVIVEE